MNDRAPIFFFDKLAALADFTTFDVRATEDGGMPVSWAPFSRPRSQCRRGSRRCRSPRRRACP
ncbi:hypothetical protein DXO206_023160 (plasmid) [Xanthomonas oryzae pv. oryzae]|nr:hypothetical protein EBA18_24810 [Xanthomonas oryzae pv. oryzae]CEH38598.1 hypothetical protein XACLG97_10900001 [Xanthomonas citri pv. citri]QEJ71050.1 hypothetical protein BXO1_025125 [Xanthomonas oryzae pv. oryzae]RBB62296.1 hypothetical protein BRN54_24190 [Xanthomonas oryzae pv. oryzae]WJS66003.1 hypothetical protein DXO206_023160 [Xanthomonas oryzae pv. oryzae]